MQLWYWRWRLLGQEPPMCLGCGGSLGHVATAWCHAGAGSIELSLEGLPFRTCGNGCADRRQPQPGFLAALRTALLDGPHVPMAQPTVQGDALSCYACANRVWGPGPDVGEVHGTLPVPGVSAIGVMVRGPIRTCNGCGKQQLVPSEDIRASLSAALGDAIEGAGVRTSYRKPSAAR